MLKSKTMNRVCCLVTAVMIAATVFIWGSVDAIRGDGSHEIGYENLLFDSGRVHTIEITMDGWDEFIANAAAEEYRNCDIVIDGEKYSNVAIRCKGNTSLSSVATQGSARYSFKVEFDHYDESLTYHGLDKLSLNNLIQDATMMKDYLAYTLMNRMDVPSPLCSYAQIDVNGETWGLYLAAEGVEDSFMDRNGMTKGELYKPDSMSFGGGRGNGADFDFEKFRVDENAENTGDVAGPAADMPGMPSPGGDMGGFPGAPSGMPDMSGGNFSFPGAGMPDMSGGNFQRPDGSMPDMGSFSPGDRNDFFPGDRDGFGAFNFDMGSDDVKLVYSDDDPDSYSNIFNNAKTKIRGKDKTRLIESIRKLNEKEDLDDVVDKDEVIRYLAVHNFLCNDDSYTGMMVHNYYLYEEDGKLSVIPWDYNLGFGGFSASGDATSTVNSPIDSPVSGGTTESRPLIAWIFSDEEALAKYHEVYSRFISENIESGWLEAEISRVKEMITPYLEKDESKFFTMEEFSKAADTLKSFCGRRGESIRGQLDGTVPSTSDGQRGSTDLVDASDISTADMGSMNSTNGGGGGGPGRPGGRDFSMPEESPGADRDNAGQAERPTADGNPGKRPQEIPDGAGFPGSTKRDQGEQWTAAGILAAILLAAILVISRVRSHNQ